MILTVTPNPSVDLLFEADRLVWDDANRVPAPRRRAGGQGINVARAVRALDGEAAAVAPLGGAAGRALEEMLSSEGLPLHPVRIAGETRVFVAAREREAGRTLLLNPRGPTLDDAERAALAAAVGAALDTHRPRWLAVCGSVPPGVPASFYAELAGLARARDLRFVPDCDGEPLGRAARAGADLLVPNRHEAGRLLGKAVYDVPAAGRAASALLGFGPAFAAVTLGERGAVAATSEAAWHAAGPVLASGSAVGAGDAFLAALLLALDGDADPPDALRRAVAAGGAVLRGTGDTLVRASDVDALTRAVEVRSLR